MRSITIALLFVVSATCSAQEKPLRRIAFGSCVHQDKPQPIWDAILAAKPDLFILAGDSIYADSPKDNLKIPLEAHYAKLGKEPGYQKLLKLCPVLATWDDHDYGLNDAGAELKTKKHSQQAFLDFFGVPKDSPRRRQEGIYHAAVFGPPSQSVQVILLDTRYFRSPLKKKAKSFPGEGPYVSDADATKTMLGEAQWQWLEAELNKPAQVRLLVSSIQVVPEDHSWEKWMNFPAEREKLSALLRNTQAAGVVVLSGDRHLAELSMMDAGIGYPLYDLTSSGLNQGNAKWRKLETNRHRVATMQYGNNFGVIDIAWGQDDPNLSLQIRDEAGELSFQHKVPLSVLKPGTFKVAKAAPKTPRLNGEPLTPALVKTLLNKEVTLDMVVQTIGAAAKAELVFLNSSESRDFTVVLDKKAQDQLRAAGIANPQEHYQGKTIRVTGTLTLFRDRPQIIISAAKQIEVVK